jgi:transcriptional regulator with XRE-family HTH domain
VLILKFARLKRGLTQRHLGQLIHLPQPYISNIELGRWNPTASQLEILGRALGIAPEVLLQEIVLPELPITHHTGDAA